MCNTTIQGTQVSSDAQFYRSFYLDLMAEESMGNKSGGNLKGDKAHPTQYDNDQEYISIPNSKKGSTMTHNEDIDQKSTSDEDSFTNDHEVCDRN